MNYIRTINRRTSLINGIEESRKKGITRFYSSAQECIRMANRCLDHALAAANVKDEATANNWFEASQSWLERGAQHVWGFHRPFGWK